MKGFLEGRESLHTALYIELLANKSASTEFVEREGALNLFEKLAKILHRYL